MDWKDVKTEMPPKKNGGIQYLVKTEERGNVFYFACYCHYDDTINSYWWEDAFTNIVEDVLMWCEIK